MAKETIVRREIPPRVHFTRIEDAQIEKKVPKRVIAEYARVYGADVKTVGIFTAEVPGKGSLYAFETKSKSGSSRNRTVLFYDVVKNAIVGFGTVEHMPNAEGGGIAQVMDTETLGAYRKQGRGARRYSGMNDFSEKYYATQLRSDDPEHRQPEDTRTWKILESMRPRIVKRISGGNFIFLPASERSTE